jgi:hypothetical protein
MGIKSSELPTVVTIFSLFLFNFCFKMTLTSILNERGESIVGILNKKTTDKIILIVHGEQGNRTRFDLLFRTNRFL